MKKRIRINGFIIFLAVVVIFCFPNIVLDKPSPTLAKKLKEVFGFSLILIGQIIRISARGYKSEHSKSGHVLIKGGPYSLVRHPMYLGIFLIGTGIVLTLFKWWVAAVFLAVFLLRYLTLIIKEEMSLFLGFPEEYKQYKQEVPRRIFPFIKMLFRSDIRNYLPLKPSWISKEIFSVIPVLLGVIAANAYEYIGKIDIVDYVVEISSLLAIIIFFIGVMIYLVKPKKHAPAKS